jgi:hypothetical protein
MDYAQALLHLGITGDAAVENMRATSAPMTGAWIALQQRDTASITLYANALKLLGITGDSAAGLLEIVDSHGHSETDQLNGKDCADFRRAYEQARHMLGC